MIANSDLRIHIINVGHGDSILVELPDDNIGQNPKPRFGLVDAGGTKKESKRKTVDYLKAFLDHRMEGDEESYIFEFICLTHPHLDHYYGLNTVLDFFLNKPARDKWPKQFWDCHKPRRPRGAICNIWGPLIRYPT